MNTLYRPTASHGYLCRAQNDRIDLVDWKNVTVHWLGTIQWQSNQIKKLGENEIEFI